MIVFGGVVISRTRVVRGTAHRPSARLLGALLLGEVFLAMAPQHHWFWFAEQRGWTVLLSLAAVAATIFLLLLWFAAVLILHWKFQFSVGSVLVLVIATSIPCSRFAAAMQRAERQSNLIRLTGIHLTCRLCVAPPVDSSLPGFVPWSELS
jgi:hypothetical protein